MLARRKPAPAPASRRMPEIPLDDWRATVEELEGYARRALAAATSGEMEKARYAADRVSRLVDSRIKSGAFSAFSHPRFVTEPAARALIARTGAVVFILAACTGKTVSPMPVYLSTVEAALAFVGPDAPGWIREAITRKFEEATRWRSERSAL